MDFKQQSVQLALSGAVIVVTGVRVTGGALQAFLSTLSIITTGWCTQAILLIPLILLLRTGAYQSLCSLENLPLGQMIAFKVRLQ